MKNGLAKYNELQASMILSAIICGIIILVSCIGLFFSLPGLLIGALVGTGVNFLFIWLVSIGSTLALKDNKAGMFFLTYALRVILLVGLFALLVILQYKLKLDVFKFSCWAMLVAFAPATFITIAVQLMHKDHN